MDTDSSGRITMSELRRASSGGAEGVPEFTDLLKVMDIGGEDIECVFAILDKDGSGDVDYQEFVDEIWKMKEQENRTTMMLVKYYVLQIWQKFLKQTEKLQD